MNAAANRILREWQKQEWPRFLQRYIDRNHNPAAPENGPLPSESAINRRISAAADNYVRTTVDRIVPLKKD